MLAELFLAFFQVGLFAIGGGYAALPLIQNQSVNVHHWLTAAQFSDLVTISQMTPGPIAINSATFVGMQMAGIPGAIAATFGCILPSLVIVSFLSFLYRKLKGNLWWDTILKTLRPVVAGLIAAAGLQLLSTALFPASSGHFDWYALFLFILSLILLRRTRLGSVSVMIIAGVIMLILGSVFPGFI